MDIWRCIGGVPLGLPRLAFVVRSVILFLLLSWAIGSHAQQAQPSPARGSLIPILEALPHASLPRGDFLGWCGLKDKVLMKVDRRIEIYDGGVKASPLSFPSAQLECGDDGQKLIFVDDEAGRASEVDIAGGVVTRTLATYEKQLFNPKIAFSPDLKSVASDRPLILIPSTINLNVVQLKAPNVRHIQWSQDSSEFFVISKPPEKARPGIVEIFNAQHQKIGSGTLPVDFLVRNGWFANSKALYLYLGSARDEFGSGVILRCTIANWKCAQIASNVLEASVGGNGVLGMVRAIGKYSNDGDTETIPLRSVVEIRNSDAQVLARQTFRSLDRYHLNLAVAPSGTKAILTWYGKFAPGCIPEGDNSCKYEIAIDLSEKLK